MRGLNIVVYANGPCVPTGFGTVIRNIFEGLVDRGKVPINDLNFYGINYTGDPHGMPFKIWPAQIAAARDPDLFGRARFANMLLGNAWPLDVLFLLEDHFTLSAPVPSQAGMQPFVPYLIQALRQQVSQGRPPFKVIQYVPIDGAMLRPNWINWIAELVDYPVAYTEFGRHTMVECDPHLRNLLKVIPHGTNPELFFPLPPEERESFRKNQLNLKPSDKLLVCVNRNQPRKDIPRTLQVFERIYRQCPDARLYLHMNVVDSAGYDLRQVIHQLRLPQHTVIFPMNFSEGVGIPVQALNMLYNSADAFITTARGEGWGLPITEAMAVGVPCVAPDHTSYSEILANGRGVLVAPEPYGVVMPSDNDQFRPLASVDGMASAVLRLFQDPEFAKRTGDAGRAWALNLTWRNHVVPRWEEVFLRCQRELMGQVNQPPAMPPGSHLLSASTSSGPSRYCLNGPSPIAGLS